MSVLNLKTRVRGLLVDNNKLSRDSILDPLTATLNRRGLRRRGQQLSHAGNGLILLDIDRFKSRTVIWLATRCWQKWLPL